LQVNKKAIILLSGGLDSATIMAMARSQGYELLSISFQYGQRHAFELEAAKNVAEAFGAIKHLIINIDLSVIGGSALTGNFEVPKGRGIVENKNIIPITYVPARNTVFLSYALAWAEVMGIEEIFIGVNALDYSGYPDCRPEYIEAFERMANLATKAAVEGKMSFRIKTPLINLRKSEIIKIGVDLGLDYKMTHSCYDPSYEGTACGECDSCQLRKRGFVEAGIKDPTRYAG
jgi:7-cyano-7-deazaguanine synthase